MRYNSGMAAIPSHIDLPEYARCALEALEGAGHEAWCVGGCVRDAMLGRPVNDYDITTSAHWQDAERALIQAGFAVHRTGTAHGTVTATWEGDVIEVTTYRVDGTYSDGRHPDDVRFVRTIQEDLARRDFTMNALAYHPERGVLDCHNGLRDLDEGVIRVVGDPRERFREDALRILRGCRFSAQLGFAIEPDTLMAMKAFKMLLTNVSRERVTHELDALLLGDHVHDALMETVDVIVAVLPEVAACRGFAQRTPYHIYDVWEHTAWVVQRSPATRLNRWAALFHDIGKPAAGFMDGSRQHFYGHPKISAQLAGPAMERLAISPAFAADVLKLVKMHDVQVAATPKAVKRTLAKLGGDVELFRALVDLKRADALAQSDLAAPRLALADDLERVLADVMANDEAFTVGQLAVNGHDVIGAGVAEGPAVGEALSACLDAVINGDVPNERDALLAFVSSLDS